VIPLPRHVMRSDGRWRPGGASPRLSRGAEGAADLARDVLGYVPDLVLDGAGDPEGYRVHVEHDGAELRAATVAGLRHGIATLRQLTQDGSVPYLDIDDAPHLPWRGALLDVARWYFPIDYLRRFVDVMALHKLNRFHLHLTDDQGWRIEITRYPRLTSIGSRRAGSQVGHARDGVIDNVLHGGYYTQDELRGLVRHAAARGVEIVPEIDFPGHTTAAIAAYPELGNGATPEVSRRWGVHTTVLNAEPPTLEFCKNVLDEVMDVFPSPWVHLGGDECPTDEWLAAPHRAHELGLDPARLQTWFTDELVAHVRSRGRTAIVWDEAVHAGLDPETVAMAWRDAAQGERAADLGHHVVMTPQQRTYFDWYQDDGPDEPLAIHGLTTLADVIGFDPGDVLGTQGMLWTEYLPTPAAVDYMAFPRLAALADIAWSGPGAAGLLDRLRGNQTLLEALGVHGRPMA
jgi:hexosaminidase